MFTAAEMTDKVLLLRQSCRECNRCKAFIRRTFSRSYSTGCTEVFLQISNITQRLREHGCFAPCTQDRGRRRTDRILDLGPEILEAIENDPQISTRRLTITFGRHSLQCGVYLLHRQELYPYHLKRVQTLHPIDPPNRIAFCKWLLDEITQAPDFPAHVLCTDDAGFTRGEVFNSAVHDHRPQEQFSLKQDLWTGNW